MVDIQKYITDSLNESADTKKKIIDICSTDIKRALEVIVSCYRAGGKLMFCGNGGSASDSQHLATEMMIRLAHDVARPALGAIALTTDSSNLTAAGNDIGFENVFARNVEGLGKPGDILVGITTSGNSPNVLRALEKARSMRVSTIGFLGGSGGKALSLCDVAIVVPSQSTQRIQEGHITIGHIICELTELTLYPKSA